MPFKVNKVIMNMEDSVKLVEKSSTKTTEASIVDTTLFITSRTHYFITTNSTVRHTLLSMISFGFP